MARSSAVLKNPEPAFARPRTRCLTVLGQDPSLNDARGVVTIQVEIPCERLEPGPRGGRFHVIDCDASTNSIYRPVDLKDKDPFERVTDSAELVSSRAFHAQNVYGAAMATLARFERALGRRTSWPIPGGSLEKACGARGHVLKIAPHAFSEANAYYSRRDEALLFGYFPSTHGRKRSTVFTCLSHDIVVHETTHALLDGLHPRYTDPSSDDQAAFHEGFADIVALLSAFQHERVVSVALGTSQDWIAPSLLTPESLRKSVLSGLAEQLGDELGPVRGNPLRSSANIEPSPELYDSEEYKEEHKRGELLVAAVMNGFLAVWCQRLRPLQGPKGNQRVARQRVIEEGAAAAEQLLTMAIRALDYTPPVDINFRDYLTALLTADREVYPNDTKYQYRKTLIEWLGKYGIRPVNKKGSPEPGTWQPPQNPLSYRRTHFEALVHDPDEAFQFIWENREALKLHPGAFTYVPCVRPCNRIDIDGFSVRETIAQYIQILSLQARELHTLDIAVPDGMPPDQPLTLYGGGTLIFDEFGRLKFHVGSGVASSLAQTKKLESQWTRGFYRDDRASQRRFARLHRARAMARTANYKERW